jgi:uncharacterized protein YjbJ (UPF0337 family)
MSIKEELKGKMENLKGRAKQAAGAVSGDKETEAKGAAERVTGAAHEKIAEADTKLNKKAAEIDEDDED